MTISLRLTRIPSLLARLLAGAAPAVAAQQRDGNLDSSSPASVAVALSGLEIAGDDDTLFAAHPDSRGRHPGSGHRRMVEAGFAPRLPGSVSEIVTVETVDWTWDVTGETHPSGSEVICIQPFDGVDEKAVIRLVRSDGFFAWLFGRDRAFVDELEARYGDGDILSTNELTPEVLADAIAAPDRDAVDPSITTDGLMLERVEIVCPDQDSGDAGPIPLSLLRATIGYAAASPAQPTGTVTLRSVATPAPVWPPRRTTAPCRSSRPAENSWSSEPRGPTSRQPIPGVPPRRAATGAFPVR